MFARHGSYGDAFGLYESPSPNHLSLGQPPLLPRKHSGPIRRIRQTEKLHLIASATVPAYRPYSVNTASTPTSTRPTKIKAVRPKQRQPPSPAMSGYSYSSSDPGSYSYQPNYQPGVPQYTQQQISAYYAQYQCYPPEPWQMVQDYYIEQPMSITPGPYHEPMTGYEDTEWQVQTTPENSSTTAATATTSSSHRRSRSGTSTRSRTWTCDIPTCTSSAHFTRLADLQRHQSTVHGVGTPEFPCYVARCNRVGEKGFTRRDHLVEHLRNFHHIDIPRRKPGERSAFPFGWPEYGSGGGGGGGGGGSAVGAGPG